MEFGHPVKVGIKSITFNVFGTTREAIIRELEELHNGGFETSTIESVEFDFDNVSGIPEPTLECSPGTTAAEIKATRRRIEEGLREWILYQHNNLSRWCESGVNRVLVALNLEPIPRPQEYRVSRYVTGMWHMDVYAISPEEAIEIAERQGAWNSDEEGDMENGYLQIGELGDLIHAELRYNDD